MLGGRETGGMNVYVRELARELGERGYHVDVFTRFQDENTPQIEPIGENARVIHLEGRTQSFPYDKNKLVLHVDQFAAR